MKRLVCLLSLGFALAAAPVLGAVKDVPPTVAVVSPPLSNSSIGPGGCTPLNPCAVAAPALGNAILPAPETPPQPDLSAAATQDPAPARPTADCPPVRGRGAFAGRAGSGRGEGRRFARAGAGGAGRGAESRAARDAAGCPRPAAPAK